MGEEVFPKKGSSGSGMTPCYSVEARTSGKPRVVNGMMLHEGWERIRFDKVEPPLNGVPTRLLCHDAESLGLVDYAAAQALRWWFHAAAGFAGPETRIVKHQVTHSYEETIVGVYHEIGDIEAVRPDVKRTQQDKRDA